MAIAITTPGPLPEVEHSAQLRKAVIASTVGTAIEWYDFFLYGTAAGLIFGKLYFPNQDRLRQWVRSERSCGNSCWKNSSPVRCWKYGS
jgi:hypothetical protein